MARAKRRADGRYCSQIYLGRDANGKKKYKSVYGKSPAELKEKGSAVRLQLGRGLDVLSQRDDFAVWADNWLRIKETEGITPRQMDNYRRAVDRVIPVNPAEQVELAAVGRRETQRRALTASACTGSAIPSAR